MSPASNRLFGSDLWMQALERYADAAHVTVKLFDAQERLVFAPVCPTPIFKLFEEAGYDPGMFADCARRCLAQTGSRPTVLRAGFYGLAVIGASLVQEGKVVAAAVGGYAFVNFSQVSEIQRLARDSGIEFEKLWQVAREQKPVPKQRLVLNGELLQVLGDALLRENYRTHQYEETVIKLEEAALETERAHQEFREQEEKLRKVEKMAATGRLAASMAHEINNPLSSVTNALYLLQNSPGLEEPVRKLVGLAALELARVVRIVKQSLSYYRVGTIPRDLDLGEIVNNSLQVFSGKILRAGIDVKPRIAGGTTLLGFSDELRQVIDNLMINAMEAMPGGGRISVSVRDSFDWKDGDLRGRGSRNGDQRRGVRLTIADTGCGISKATRIRMFEPFFTTKAEKGTGLGLWILQAIILKHEGVLTVRSSERPGRSGTAMSVFLPCRPQTSRKSAISKKEPAA